MSVASVSSSFSDAMASSEVMNLMNEAFNRTPTTKTIAYCMLRSMWLRCPHRFRVTAGIHQNSMIDPLHFSVAVDTAEGWMTFLHVNGFYKNRFIIQTITAQTTDNGVKLEEIIAVF